MAEENTTKKLLKYLKESGATYEYDAVIDVFRINNTVRSVSNRKLKKLGHEIKMVHTDGTYTIGETL